MSKTIIRVIEGGGKGFRIVDVCGGKIIGKVRLPTKPITNIIELTDFVKDYLVKESTQAIAFSLAGDIKDHNQVILSPNIHFLDGIKLGEFTTKVTGLPTYVANDMEASVTGMSTLFPELSYFLGITWSSGIGIRIFKNGEILSDSEGGHICIDPSPFAPLCGCGRHGCAESIIGGKSTGRRLTAELEARGIVLPEDKNVFAYLDESYLNHEFWAIEAYITITKGMGIYLSVLQNILHLPAIVFKGTFAKKALALPHVEDIIRVAMREHLMNPDWERGVKFFIVPGPPKLMEDAESFLGAAKLAEQII
jgi:predicted NBD/HSP70 family sugar kinase